eukprot:CAMPEP_0119129924 /NCGR_PEP_ID=MMETSP1310-20130426/7471_1 /TAXON_ID=464262 /ORGANISM="Genus nov. species nov., Strain RCC2339" /LENGTH=681 /DNA_ID=CAMNT_0007120385 /DNA_START=360 /DNA_END=2405 /DNA_ORIENTATION=+
MADHKAALKKFNPKDLPRPSYFDERLKVWDEVKAKAPKVEPKPISITLPDGKKVDGVAGETTPLVVAKGISQGLAKNVVVAKVNDSKLWDIWRPLEEDCSLRLYTFDSEEGRDTFWHSSAHVLGLALESYFGADLCIGPPTDSGFYYDCHMGDRTVKDEELDYLQKVVQHITNQKEPFERLELSREDALRMFSYNKYKTEIISTKVPEGDTITAYRCGPLIDLCRGPHVPDTSRVKAFKVLRNSSAYWMGKKENDSLQRVYGVTFPNAKELKAHLHMLEEAKKRDHRVIGAKQELFMFSSDKSAGSAFFLPHGTVIYNKLTALLRNEYRKRGYSEVKSPNIYNSSLWETSGHWQMYKENMFTFDVEGQVYGLKPMNCPGHCLMFGHRSRSYRELPLRFADFGVLHRNELSGALTGLTRVRRFQQDDCHIFCTNEQVKQELNNEIDFMKHVYGIFGYKFALELSTRPENYLGDPKVWDEAEKSLEEVLNSRFGQGEWQLNPGDGAFYGPKIDIHITDAIGRSHQCATIQLDFQLPERFNLQYKDQKGGFTRPVIVHRAVYGSLERFMAILIEHTAGKWPFWLSPRQAIVLNVSEASFDYARKVHNQLFEAGFDVEMDVSDKTINKKVREAQLAQYNYMLVVGEKEVGDNTVNVRQRDVDKPLGTWTIADTITKFQEMVDKFE